MKGSTVQVKERIEKIAGGLKRPKEHGIKMSGSIKERNGLDHSEDQGNKRSKNRKGSQEKDHKDNKEKSQKGSKERLVKNRWKLLRSLEETL